MKMKISILILVLLLAGCATIPQGIAPEAKPLVTEKGEDITYKVIGKGIGSASHFSLFSIIPFGRADIDKAINKAINTLNGDNLINTHYYVTTTWVLIGHLTEISVKGDVIKYTGSKAMQKQTMKKTETDFEKKTSEEKQVDLQQNNTEKEIVEKSSNESNKSTFINTTDFLKNVHHKITLGSAVQGFAIDYTLQKPINKFLFYSVGIGYKNVSQNYSYGYGEYRWNYRYNYSLIPITANIGVTGKTFLEKENLPINPYASIGLAYLPPEQWDALGINLKIGAVYKIPEIHNIGLGLEYQYFSGYNGFSNLNLSVIFRP